VSHLMEEKETARGENSPTDDSFYMGRGERVVKPSPHVGDGKPVATESVEMRCGIRSPGPGRTRELARSV
jgi:hypothetical protein